jgi:hypothetical protein
LAHSKQQVFEIADMVVDLRCEQPRFIEHPFRCFGLVVAQLAP